MRKLISVILGCGLMLGMGYAVAEGQLFQDPDDFDPDWPPLMVEVLIPSHGEMLTGTFYKAGGQGPHPTVVTLHAFPGYEKNLDLAQSLRRIGYNVLYFDYRGLWGGPADFSVASGYEDAASAIAFVTDKESAAELQIDTSRIILFGHSYGAVASLDVGAIHPDVQCVISVAPEDMTLMIRTADDRESLARYVDNLRVLKGYPGEVLIDDLEGHSEEWAMTTTVKELGDKPYLIIGGALDSNFNADEVARVATAGKTAGASRITATVIANADHSFSAKRIELTLEVASWLQHDCN
jgi:dipeptidyl aminopeptidase/acylaminoacyl peptidase